MQDLLRGMVEQERFGLVHHGRGFPPAIKVDGMITPVSKTPLTTIASERRARARSIMNDKQSKEFDQTKECNFAINMPRGIGRFRVNAFVQQGNATGAVLRTITTEIPEFDELQPAAHPQGRGHDQARPGDLCRRYRLG